MGTTQDPTKSRIERKKEETRKKIINVAVDLFNTQGLEITTMEQIAKEVDIAKGTLYNYFPGKDEIINEYIRQSFSIKNPDRIARLRELPDTRTRMLMIIRNLLEGVRRQKDIFEKYIIYQVQNMISFHRDEQVRSGIHLLIIEIITLGQASGEIRKDFPDYILIDLFDFVFIEIAKEFYRDPDGFAADAAIERGVDLFINGVGDKSRKKDEICKEG